MRYCRLERKPTLYRELRWPTRRTLTSIFGLNFFTSPSPLVLRCAKTPHFIRYRRRYFSPSTLNKPTPSLKRIYYYSALTEYDSGEEAPSFFFISTGPNETCLCDEIGRHARLKTSSREGSWFKSRCRYIPPKLLHLLRGSFFGCGLWVLICAPLPLPLPLGACQSALSAQHILVICSNFWVLHFFFTLAFFYTCFTLLTLRTLLRS